MGCDVPFRRLLSRLGHIPTRRRDLFATQRTLAWWRFALNVSLTHVRDASNLRWRQLDGMILMNVLLKRLEINEVRSAVALLLAGRAYPGAPSTMPLYFMSPPICLSPVSLRREQTICVSAHVGL